MRKFNVKVGISAVLLALSLVAGSAGSVNAAKLDKSQIEVNQVGVATFGAPQASVKEKTASGQVTTSWTFNYVPPTYVDPSDNKTYGPTVRMMVYNKGDRTNPEVGSVSKDWMGNLILEGEYVGAYQDPEYNKAPKYEKDLYAYNLTPGKKEVVFYVYDSKAYSADLETAKKTAHDAWVAAGSNGTDPMYDYNNDKYLSKAAYYYCSAPIEIEVSMEADVYTSVTTTSIELSMDGSNATGYEISRKSGSKYVVVANVASRVYKDNGLESKKEYSYKVRPYYVDDKTGEKTYGKYTEVSAVTRGSALQLKSKINNKNKVVLSWAKVADATKYEIYRYETDSYSTSKSKGIENDYSNMKLIATVKKSKKTYTDKNISANRSYEYRVRAVLAKNKANKKDKNYYVEAYTWVSLNFREVDMNVTNSYTDANGNKTIEWTPVYGADGYLVEREVYNTTTETYDWVPVATLGKTATKYQFAAIGQTDKDGKITSYEDTYRIRATRKGEYSHASTYNTTKKLGVVSKVTAKAVANGIQVSWTPVAGASYYRVYRIPTSAIENNKDLGGYAKKGYEVTEYVGATEAKPVDVAAWNAAVDADIAAYEAAWKTYDPSKGDEPDYYNYWNENDKLSTNRTYHYQNYSYARDTFDANTTSIVDYCGDIYHGDVSRGFDNKKATIGADGKAAGVKLKWFFKPVCQDEYVEHTGLKAGVDYQYYVVAYADTAKAAADYDDYEISIYDEAAYNAAMSTYNTKKAAYDEWQKKYDAWQEYNYSYDSESPTGKDESIKPDYPEVTYDDQPAYPNEPGKYGYYNDEEDRWISFEKYVPVADDVKVAYYTSGYAFNTAYTPGTKSAVGGQAVTVIDPYDFKGPSMSTSAVKSIGQATFTSVAAPGKAAIKSAKSAKKGQITVTIKSKVAGATSYKIYRATKKKGKYVSVGTTTSLKFVDTGVSSKKTYYYKVVAVTENEAKADVEGAASAVKSAKAK